MSVIPTLPPALKAALLRTAEWLEAHPNQHAAGGRVQTRNNTAPTLGVDDPETDVCYCAAGRLAYELGYGIDNATNYNFVDENPRLYAQIYFVNDTLDLGYLPDTERVMRGDPAVIPFLKELAA